MPWRWKSYDALVFALAGRIRWPQAQRDHSRNYTQLGKFGMN